MHKINNFDDAKRALFSHIKHDAEVKEYKLDLMQKLMRYLGNPQNKYKVVHIAGTSGKTSTSYYVSSLLTQAGFKVGLTVSPYVDEINERVQINTEPLAEEYFCEYLDEFLHLLDDFEGHPSYFETLVAFSFWVFAKQRVDYAVIEVGLGGLLDATNVIDRSDKVCVITDIGIDHTNILGNTLPEIAYQKAGIILSNNHVFMLSQPDEVVDVVKRVADEKNADLHLYKQTNNHAFLKDLPLFQQRNWQLAYEAVKYVLKSEGKKPLSMQQKIASANIQVPGRMDKFVVDGKTVILDGSHNPQKINALIKSVVRDYPDKNIATLISLGHNKTASLDEVLEIVVGVSSSITATKFNFGQDEFRLPIEPQIIVDELNNMGYTNAINEPSPDRAFYKLLDQDVDVILVTGSFFLLNNIRPIVKKLQLLQEQI